jgi:hypothetical protein
MQSINANITHESWDSARDAQRVNRGLIAFVHYRNATYRLPIGAGESDDVNVFRDGPLVYVVSVNRGLGYAGLQVFELTSYEPSKYNAKHRQASEIGETFLQADYEIDDILGKRGVDLHPRTIAKRLADYAIGN